MNGQSEIVMIVYLKIEVNKRILSRVAISVYCMNNYEGWKNNMEKIGFPTGRDSATFRDKGTEVPSLSRDKGTMRQAQNLATRRDSGRDGTITIFL